MSEKQPGARLEALDGLRGIAALGVVVWHYQHFGGNPGAYPYRNAWVFEWLYARSWVLVDFFFVLSGCVFTQKYLLPLSEGRVSAREFFMLRLSRIYPLHLATLLVIAAIQWWRMAHHRPTLIYEHNDAYHFFLNLFFLQGGWFEHGFNYNNPSWSIAVEVFVYVLFFVVASRHAARYVLVSVALLLLAMGIYRIEWMYPLLNGYIARATLGFFTGSLLLLALRRLKAAGFVERVGIASALMLGCILTMTHFIGYDAFTGYSGGVLPHVLLIFPLTTATALTFTPVCKVLSSRVLAFFGDISYAVYLVHVPLQMVILSIWELRGQPVPTSSPAFFWGFFGSLVLLATVTYRAMERPIQSWMRRRFLAEPTPDEPFLARAVG